MRSDSQRAASVWAICGVCGHRALEPGELHRHLVTNHGITRADALIETYTARVQLLARRAVPNQKRQPQDCA